jgi:hypothetical protein
MKIKHYTNELTIDKYTLLNSKDNYSEVDINIKHDFFSDKEQNIFVNKQDAIKIINHLKKLFDIN